MRGVSVARCASRWRVRRGARGARDQNPLRTLIAAPRARATSVDVRPRDAALAEPSRDLCRAASSTRFQDAIEHVARHPAAVVMPEGKLVEVQREIVLR